VEALPPATTFLNYPKQGPSLGAHLGPNLLGEYLTVVELVKTNQGMRVGLAYGIIMVNGESLDPAGLPFEAQQALNRAALAQLQAFKTPGIQKVR
jgi:hypothetical protein